LIRPWQTSGARAASVLVFGIAATMGYAAFLHRTVPLGDWLVWRIAVLWLLCGFLASACLSAGYRIVRACVSVARLRTPEVLVLSSAAGLVAFVLSMYAAGALRLFGPALAVVLPAALLLSGARPLAAFVRQRVAREPRPEERWIRGAAWVFGAFGVLWVYAGAMTPEAINFDASWSHLAIAADYARAGRIVAFDADYTRCFPHLASVVATWAMIVPSWLVGGEAALRWMLALHVEFTLFLGTLVGVRAVVEWLLDESDAHGAWAGFFLVPAIFVYDKNLGGAADHVLAFFAPPLFLAAMRACPRAGRGSYALAGAFGGAALLTKYQAVYLLAGVFAVFAGLVVARIVHRGARVDGGAYARGLGAEGRGILVLAGAFAAVASPIFIENAVFHHNPVYPFLIDAFPSRPIVPRANALFEGLFKDDRYRPKGPFFHRVATSARLALSWPFEPHYSFTHNLPDGAALFPLGLPMLLAVRPRGRIGLGYAACLVALFAWAMTFRVDRHVQTFMPLIAAATTALLIRAWQLGLLARVGVFFLVGLQILWGADAPFASGRARIESALDLVDSSYAGTASSRFQGFRSRERSIASVLPADARVLLHTYRPSLGIERDVALDWAGQQGLISYDSVRDPASLYALYRSLGITHLLWLPGQRPAPSKQEDVLFTDLVSRDPRAVERFSDEALLALPVPADAPVPQAPYFVVSLGLPGYPDGLYPVESMSAQEAMPDRREPFASPAVPWSSDEAEQVALLLRANAVCVGVKAPVSPSVREVLGAFQKAETYKGEFAIYVRRPPR
jgi:hypothetical protein